MLTASTTWFYSLFFKGEMRAKAEWLSQYFVRSNVYCRCSDISGGVYDLSEVSEEDKVRRGALAKLQASWNMVPSSFSKLFGEHEVVMAHGGACFLLPEERQINKVGWKRSEDRRWGCKGLSSYDFRKMSPPCHLLVPIQPLTYT